ncbi:MAG: DUF302 domain-containing protein, partial [Ignavibacteriaceae bacterium]
TLETLLTKIKGTYKMKKLNLNLAGIFFALILFAASFTQSNQLFAQDNSVVTVQSKKSFDESVDQLRQLVAKNGMMVLSEINHGKILSMTGLEVKGIALFVGNPQIGKQLFTANRGAGLAVPIRVNIYEDTDGKTYVNYIKPTHQLSSFNNDEIDKIAGKLDEKLGMLTEMISK